LELANIVMIYLLAVVFIALQFGRGPAILASVLGVASFDFFFVPPKLTFAISDWQYVVTFAIMLVVGLLISNLAASVRLQARVAGHRERRTALLYAMSHELAGSRGQEAMAKVAVRHIGEVFDSQVVVLLPDASGRIRYPRGESIGASFHGADLDIAQWVHDHGEVAGLGTNTLPGSEALYLPLKGSQAVLGVLAVLPANPRRVLLPEQFHLLETFASQLALALERAQLAERAQQARVAAEMEGLRNTLLASISHDLRTPLAIIAGTASTLADKGDGLDPTERRRLAQSVYAESRKMGEMVGNVLNLIRLESGGTVIRPDWISLEEVAGSALNRLREALATHKVSVNVAEAPELIRADPVLLEQLLFNLLDNAIKYTPADSRISIAARREGSAVELLVADDGPGFPTGIDPASLFDKFQRGRRETTHGGVGLGLAICRAIALAHGGEIRAERIPAGGALFVVTLPQTDVAPEVPREAA
jgi:two-component system sensor histidine kinase KdpD